MRYKKIIMLTILIVGLLAVSAVSATDNATDDVVSVEKTTTDVVKETTDEVVSVGNDEQVILEKSDENESLHVANYNSSRNNSNDDVLTYDYYISYAQITTNTITGYAGDYITLKATVKNDLGIAKKATVEFRLNGKTYTTTTNSNGVASITVKCPSTEFWGTSIKTTGNILTKSTNYKKYYICDVTAYGTDYYKNTDNFHVISKKSPVVKKYKIIKKIVTRTIKVRNGLKTYVWGNYGLVTYKYKHGYSTKIIESVMAKKKYGLITFFIKHHYKKNGKWKWEPWKKVSKGNYYNYIYGFLIKCDKIKVRYLQVIYKRI